MRRYLNKNFLTAALLDFVQHNMSHQCENTQVQWLKIRNAHWVQRVLLKCFDSQTMVTLKLAVLLCFSNDRLILQLICCQRQLLIVNSLLDYFFTRLAQLYKFLHFFITCIQIFTNFTNDVVYSVSRFTTDLQCSLNFRIECKFF